MEITKLEVNSLFEYKEGELYWIKSPAASVKCGSKVGNVDIATGYKRATIYGKRYYVHRLVFLYHNGYLPKFVDHINCNREDNRIENLREATKNQNQHNQGLQKSNTSGYKGVTYNKKLGKWQSRIHIENKCINLGLYDTAESAGDAYKKASVDVHKEFSRTSK